MTKQLIALAFAAAFGIAHAADVKPATTEAKAAAPAVAKTEAPKAGEAAKAEVKVPEAKAAAAPAEVKKAEAKPAETAKVAKKADVKAAPETAKVEAVKAAEPAKK